MGFYLRTKLEGLAKYGIVGNISGIGLLQALFLVKDNAGNTPLDPRLKVGGFIRDYCYRNGLIMRNNGDILVMAPALIIMKEQIDEAIFVLENAIKEALIHFKI
ncbi:MAG: hypothetical protein AB1798_22315 [Spirochaetota bacterium]